MKIKVTRSVDNTLVGYFVAPEGTTEAQVRKTLNDNHHYFFRGAASQSVDIEFLDDASFFSGAALVRCDRWCKEDK